MKLQIIQLEAEDDQVTVRDKLASAKAPRVVLVWPVRGRPLRRRLDLRLVERAARQRNIELGLICFDPDVIQHSATLGMPNFASVDAVPEGEWPRLDPIPAPHRRRTREQIAARVPREPMALSPGARRAVFSAAILSVIITALALVPHAEVALLPATERVQFTFTALLRPGAEEVTPQGDIPARPVEVEVSGEHRLPTEGTASVPTTRATGEIQITNLTSEELGIPAGTGVRSGEIRFATAETDRVPAEGKVLVPIMAIDPGRQGNLAPHAIDTVDGELGLAITVTNPEPTTGGANQLRGAVTARDLENVEQALIQILTDQARQRMEEQLLPSETVAHASVAVAETLRHEFDAAAGDSRESVGVAATIRFAGLTYDLANLETAARMAAEEGLALDRGIRPGSLEIEAVTQERPEALQVTARHATYRMLEAQALRRKIRGKSLAEAVEILLEDYDLAAPPSVLTFPGWFKRMPWLDMRIDVRWVWESLG